MPRQLIVWGALAVGLIGLLAALIFIRSAPPLRGPPALSRTVHARLLPHRTIGPAKPVVQKPPAAATESEFDREQQMTPGQRMKRWNDLILQASVRFSVPMTWIHAVMAAESSGRTMSDATRPLTSSAGALGLMQLMPETYNEMRRQYGLGTDPHNPHDNIFAGAAYLRQLYLKYGYPQMFAAYNDGPGNLEELLLRGRLMPEATGTYVSGIRQAVESGRGPGGPKVKFTRPNGTPIWIDAYAVASVRAALPGEYAPRVRSVITIGRMRQGICESLAAARAILRSRGGRV